MPASPKNSSTWVKFKPGICADCRATCCDSWPVEVSMPDLIRLGLITPDEASADLGEAIAGLKKRGLVAKFRPRDMVATLARRKTGDCIFLGAEDRRCTVYAKRPEICRAFPKIGPRPGYCPKIVTPRRPRSR